jgi:hypothetical protein
MGGDVAIAAACQMLILVLSQEGKGRMSTFRFRFFKCISLGLLLAVFGGTWSSPAVHAAEDNKPTAESKKPSKFRKFSDVTEGAKKYEGLLDLYEKDQHLYAVLTGGDFDKPFLAPMTIARGAGSAGMSLNFGEQWIIAFKRVGDRVQLIRKNLRYEAPKGTPLEKAVHQNYTDSVLMALPIVSDDAPGGGVLIDLNDIFFSDFAELGAGSIDRSKASWFKIKTYPNNVELQVQVTFSRPPRGAGLVGDYGYIDPRGITLVMHYSLVKMPEGGYRPRLADQRVGYFLNATKDFGSTDPDTTFVRRINRWRLEKADPDAKLSPPKKQIVWWVEDTVPHEYRPYVEAGILEWNKAFEKIGFRNAVSVRWQNDQDSFDPEDINYCTFRWVTTPMTFAMSNLRSNPVTGEMIDGDVIFDASWIRYWQQEHAYLVAVGAEGDGEKGTTTLGVGDIISPMLAVQRGYGMPMSLRGQMGRIPLQSTLNGEKTIAAVPGTWSSFHAALSRKAPNTGCCAACQYAASMQAQFRMVSMALAAKGGPAELPEEMLGQVIKSVVMHEVGHSLGLRHNFRASNMLPMKDLHNTKITREKGLVGSVMDYTPVNIARAGEEQGDYATTTLGPYDYWAIEYAYKPISGDEKEELKKIAARSPEPELDFATDEDLYDSYDPRDNVYDLSSNPLEFAKHRIELANDVLKEMDKNLVRDGESWARLRPAFLTVLQQYGDAAYVATRYIGGRHIARDARGESSRDPVSPVSGEEQRTALKFIADNILIDQPIPIRPELLRRVSSEHWMHWGSSAGVSSSQVAVPYFDYIEAIQNIAISEMFGDGSRFDMIENNEALVDADGEPLKMAEVFRTFTDAVWSDINKINDSKEDEQSLALSKVRRNMQRVYMQNLVNIVLGPKNNDSWITYAFFSNQGNSFPADARALARQHLKEIHSLISGVLKKENVTIDELSRAHLGEISDQLEKTLNASVTAGKF